MTIKRIVCAQFPTWSIDRVLRRLRRSRTPNSFAAPAEPMVMLTAQKANAQFIAACCTRSAARGVMPGMSVAHARALAPASNALIVEPHQPDRDMTALVALANWAIRFTPLAAPDPPDGLLLDVTGCERLYGSESRLLELLQSALNRLGFRTRLACASTIGCAWAAARFDESDRIVIAPSEEREAIDPLPIEALRLDPETCRGLHEVNLDRIEQLLVLPRMELAVRFDPLLLQRLDQALGRVDEVIEPIRPRDPVLVHRVFQGPVKNLEAILLASRESIAAFASQLHQQELGTAHVQYTLKRSDLPPLTIDVRLSHPSRDAAHLWLLLRPKIEAAHMGFGIEELTLRALRIQRIAHQQTGTSFAPASHARGIASRAAGMLIDTLSQRLGNDRTLMVNVRESHRPERVADRTPAALHQQCKPDDAAMVDADRPSILLAQPERIDVMAMTPDGPPIWMRWRGIAQSLISAHGPERLAGEWWRGLSHAPDDRRTRDYFKVQDETGRWLWVYRSNPAGGDSAATSDRWFIQGVWT